MKKLFLPTIIGMFSLLTISAANAHDPRGHLGFHSHNPNLTQNSRYWFDSRSFLGFNNGLFLGLGNVIIGAGTVYPYHEPYRYRSPRLWCETIEVRNEHGYLESRKTVCQKR